MRDYASGYTIHHRVSEEWPPRPTASRYRQPKGCFSAPDYRATELPSYLLYGVHPVTKPALWMVGT